MANKTLFASTSKAKVPTDTINEAGGKAYKFTPEHALAQYCMTGCLTGTFYASAETQLDTILELCESIKPEYIAKLAIYARKEGYMKDTPALLCAILANKDIELLKKVFSRVIDNGKMLRNFVQIIRSGKIGRKSLGSCPRNLIREWLEERSDEAVFAASVGNDPSLADIIKMIHVRPKNKIREALYAYILGKSEKKVRYLPKIIKDYEAFKSGKSKEIPDVPFQMLTSLELDANAWAEIAKNSSWHMLRMNLNTFMRHNVLSNPKMVKYIADRLRNKEEIVKSKVFPYQLLCAYLNTTEIPQELSSALQDAMEIAINNTPEIDGKIFVFPDVSGSMSNPITGDRGSVTTKVRCIDIAALVASAILNKNPNTEIMPFEGKVCSIHLNPRDSIMTNAQKLSAIGGGSTNCSAPLALLNSKNAKGDLIIYVSDNQSWIDTDSNNGNGTETMQEWTKFKKRNPDAKMICIDIQAYDSTQAQDRKDILNIGGFSDSVFDVINEFSKNQLSGEHWVGLINEIMLDEKK